MCVLIRHCHIPHNTPCLLPKSCITFVSHFSWVLQSSQEKLNTMLIQNFWGQTRCIVGGVEMANSEKIQVARGIFHGIYHSKTLHNVYIKTIRYIFSKICNENFVGINMESQINSVLQITDANLLLFL